jgi:DNA-binding NtrC family response regulator
MMGASNGRVLVLDDDRDFCELLGAFLESATGAECVAVHSLAELVLRQDDAMTCRIAILDVNLGPGEPSGIDALEWLRSNGFPGRIVFLTGHARRHPILGEHAERSGLEILEKPVDAGTLVALVSSHAV